ncbi:hypothetical protein HNY73_003272 [Argiope bruennichi]|uniref:Uncharacterized protein n=1 Tax=Argiope bruennichi TaxID=94029 RepID=A0A8T0FXF1_ARGBR|nr:hypothetical protein HNY73_003272 [Argiope bruennichi]
MASIDDQPIVETIGENCHIIEFSFTVNNYRDIISLDFIKEYKILCTRFRTEWTIWILFQKFNPSDPVSSIVCISRTDDEDVKVMVNFNLVLHNVSTLECTEVLDVSTSDIEKGWDFRKNIEPLLQSETSSILNNGSLDVKFTLAVFNCHE